MARTTLTLKVTELSAAIDAVRDEARAVWPGCYVSVVTYGKTTTGPLGFSMRIDADASEDCTRILYAGPTVSDPLLAVTCARQDPAYQDARTKAMRAKGRPS